MMLLLLPQKYVLFFKKKLFCSKKIHIFAALIEANHNKDYSVVKTLGSLVL